MGRISVTTHEFHLEKVDNDPSCLYTSFRHVDGILNTIDNKHLRSLVADYIGKNETLHPAVFRYRTSCKTVKEYCSEIVKNNFRGGEPELQALAILGHILIRVVSMTKTAQYKITVTISNYDGPVELELPYKKCVYIFYDEDNKHYQPLFVINKEDSDEKFTTFERNDEAVTDLLHQFIREVLHADTFIQLDYDDIMYEIELPTNTDLLNGSEHIPSAIIPKASTSLPSKRKLPAHDNLSFAQIIEQELSPRMPNKNDDLNEPAKFAKLDTYKTPAIDESNSELMTIEQYLQMDFFANEYTVAQQSITDSSMISNQEPDVKMTFEVEPAAKFRGRTLRDFKPKKAQKRNGEPSEARKPRYFADRNNQHYLNLLIPETHLLADLLRICFEICIVTREIDGYTYIHPYFKFQVHPTDRQSPNLNPIYRFLDGTVKLEACPNKLLRQLKLKLVIIMHKNNELMQSEQPLQIFSSPKNTDNKPAITTKFVEHKTFKKAYHLHDLRFAITLWKKQPGEKVFHRHDDIQYISQISTEDRSTKVRRNKKH